MAGHTPSGYDYRHRSQSVMQFRRNTTAFLTFGAWLVAGTAFFDANRLLATEAAIETPSHLDSAAMARRVDELLETLWATEQVEPAPAATDSEFLRRVYLDLVGVIPRVSEVREFLSDQRPNKRALVIERLLASPRHATHMATTLRNRILPLGIDPIQDQEALGLQKWLRTQFARNLRYDNLVGGLLLTTGGDDLGPALYFRANDFAPEKMAASVAELFLGVKLQCAQCHDHPFAEWSQHDFWGVAAFFARVQSPDDRMMNRRRLRVIDADRGEVAIPDTNETVAPQYLAGEIAPDDKWQSRRSQFVTWLASSDNQWFARAAVNWAWTELFGLGLVDSLDDIDPSDDSPHVRILDELADYFVETGFDTRQLWRTLANTRAYQLSTRHERPESMSPELFARKLVRPLTPERLYDSLAVIVPPELSGSAAGRAQFSIDEDPLRIEFVRQMRPPPGSATEFRGSTLQALMMMNGVYTATVTAAENRMLAALDAPFLDNADRVEAIFLATLSRQPNNDECQRIVAMLQECETAGERNAVLSDLLWALVNSTEFAFIH